MKPAIRRVKPDAEYYFKEGCHILELSNTPDDPQVSIARARVVPGVTTRLHCLKGIIERYVIIEGSGRVEVNGEAGHSVEPGNVVVIPEGHSQRIANTGATDLVF